ncbi:MAG TPA: FdrA family protein [Streptosporangiaceae bacterium]|nr:FdrA family protein [Streptosporangiaceae bacterium]
MTIRCLIRPSAYFDSVVLMRIAGELGGRPGVDAASLVMATEANKQVLAGAGLLTEEAKGATANDLVLAVAGQGAAVDDALRTALKALERGSGEPGTGAGGPPQSPPPVRARTLAGLRGAADLAVISTPGRYAAAEALKALRLGLHVFLFSDNVPVEQEVFLKEEAQRRGLLVMGPDCGTAIIGGVPLGFANAVRRGDIGLIGASGTGLQQVSVLIDAEGGGVSQVIGVGSRDLSGAVGGRSAFAALDALAADPGTRVIVLISKPPAPEVADRIMARAARAGKPVIACFLGYQPPDPPPGVRTAATLEAAALAAVGKDAGDGPEASGPSLTPLAARPAPPPCGGGGGGLLRALYTGGTFACESRLLLLPQLGTLAVHPAPPAPGEGITLPDAHVVLDLGDDRFTVGRPHPMIYPEARTEFLRAAMADQRSAVVVLDIVLGYGAAPDPAGPVASVLAEAAGRPYRPAVVAFIVGTAADPQGLARQERMLRDAGAVLAPSSTAAARLAGQLLAAPGAVG